MNKLLVVVDMQNDFISGSLGTPEAQAIVKNVAAKIKGWDGTIVATKDTHSKNYLETREGKYLPVEHCIKDTDGWYINDEIVKALNEADEDRPVYFTDKPTFGSVVLPDYALANHFDYIELVGLCTDICVISNALLLKAYLPATDIAVDASCCAGVSPELHKAALNVMRSCQIDIINEV